jgi:hypothetical protein
MLIWLQNHIFTILIIAVLIAFFGFLVYTLIRDKRKGKSSCCGGCAGCAMAGQCHGHQKNAEEATPDDGQNEADSTNTTE